MTRMISIYMHSSGETKTVTLEEAQRIIDDEFNDPEGGIIIDAKTYRAISHIGPDTEGIIIMEQMLGTG
jgi:hypothetical protein